MQLTDTHMEDRGVQTMQCAIQRAMQRVARARVILATAGVALIATALPQPGRAQGTDSLYHKAQEMVSNGDAAAGRALVDSLLNAAPAGSPQYAEGLYWRAALAASATQAEHDYQRIVVDYPFSRRADDALLRLGELELMRADYDAALLHLQRLTRDHPNTPLRAKASYWTARAFFEQGNTASGCAANADALAHVVSSDVELKNQIDYQRQRCHGAAPQSVAQNVPQRVAQNGAQSGATSHVVAPPESTVTAETAQTPPPTQRSVSAHAARSAAHGAPTSHAAPHHRTPSLRATPSAEGGAAAQGTGRFAVQVAAYYDRSQADGFAAKLRKRGYAAHVDGTTAPFRVRIGQYATHAAAEAALARLQAKQITGFVTKE